MAVRQVGADASGFHCVRSGLQSPGVWFDLFRQVDGVDLVEDFAH
jgi:hypothetical protein